MKEIKVKKADMADSRENETVCAMAVTVNYQGLYILHTRSNTNR